MTPIEVRDRLISLGYTVHIRRGLAFTDYVIVQGMVEHVLNEDEAHDLLEATKDELLVLSHYWVYPARKYRFK